MESPSTRLAWVTDFARKYRSGAISQFVLHGNINDYVPVGDAPARSYASLRDYVSGALFKNADLVVFYDRSSGVRFKNEAMLRDFTASLQAYDTVHRTTFAQAMPRDPVSVFALLEMHFRKRLSDSTPRSIAFIVEYAETLIPMNTSAQYGAEDRIVQVFLQRWANEDIFKNADLSIVLTTENLANLNTQYLRSPFVHEITIPYPSEEDRAQYIDWHLGKNQGSEKLFEMERPVLAKNTAGLNLAQLRILLSEIIENKIIFTHKELTNKKKELIEAEAAGLLEFVGGKFSLKDVAGHRWAKQHLIEAATALKSGRSDVMPMGYLVNGPVGTGKTYMVTCFANDIGVPMVMLKNFRSKWQGETEGNLEKVLNLLKAMAPVAVMIDEADAYLGDRNQEGDSGVGSRVFSMIATFMSNTEHRGKIIWFLLTARPDLMPVDFKRQGRAEEHIALFYPETIEEKKELFTVMLRKTDIDYLKADDFGDAFFNAMPVFSGAEMEAALTRSKFRAAAQGAEKVTPEVVKAAIEDFLPPTYREEIELMNYAAVLECTSKQLLPEKYRSLTREEVVKRVRELQAMIGR